MAPDNRIVSSVLLAAGIVLVVAGLNAFPGLTVPGIVASIAAVAALLYAGRRWFGPTPDIAVPAGAETVLVFDQDLHVVAGPGQGRPLLPRFPSAIRPEIEARCRAALRGQSSRIVCDSSGVRLVIETAPVASITGVVLYGTLITSRGISVPALAVHPASTIVGA